MTAPPTDLARLLERPLVRRLAATAYGRVTVRAVDGLARIELFDRAMTLAAQAFTSVFPVVIVVALLRPEDAESLGALVADHLGLPDDARSSLEAALPEDQADVTGFGVVGTLIVLVSATSFSRALTRCYCRIWDAPRAGFRSAWRWIAVILAVVLSVVLVRAVQRLADGGGLDGALDAVAIAVVNGLVWTWVPWMLMAGVVRWRLLLAGGVLMGVASVFVAAAGEVYLPRAMTAATASFGPLGVAFTYISWLFVISFALVVTAVVGSAVARDEGPVGAWLRRGSGIGDGTRVVPAGRDAG